MLYLYFDNFELIASGLTSDGEIFTILQKREEANIKFPCELFL